MRSKKQNISDRNKDIIDVIKWWICTLQIQMQIKIQIASVSGLRLLMPGIAKFSPPCQLAGASFLACPPPSIIEWVQIRYNACKYTNCVSVSNNVWLPQCQQCQIQIQIQTQCVNQIVQICHRQSFQQAAGSFCPEPNI